MRPANIIPALTAFVICLAQPTLAKTWPAKPLHVVVPFAAGSLADIVPRIVFDRVSAQLHEPVAIENRPGAGTTIGAATVARASPDGYTILVNSNAQVVAPLLYANLPYQGADDFVAIALLGTYPNVLVMAPSKHIGTLGEFVRAAKARNGDFTFASLGVGSATYMNAERFRLSVGYDAIHVPFKGAPAAIREVMEGRVDYCFCGVGTTLPLIRQGKLVALAISTRKRSPLLPDVPTTVEAGFPASDYTPWLGLFAPTHTPRKVIERLHDEVVETLQASQTREKLSKLGIEPFIMSVSGFDAFVKREATLNKALVEALRLKRH
jgi:tripartite-type tricarboxylate transporter receptor subunit TctC